MSGTKRAQGKLSDRKKGGGSGEEKRCPEGNGWRHYLVLV